MAPPNEVLAKITQRQFEILNLATGASATSSSSVIGAVFTCDEAGLDAAIAASDSGDARSRALGGDP